MQIIDITTTPRGRRHFDAAHDDFGPSGRAYALGGLIPERTSPNGTSFGRGLAAVRTPFGLCVCAAESYCGSVSFAPATPSDRHFDRSVREMIRAARAADAPVLYQDRARPVLMTADDLERMLAEHEERVRARYYVGADGYLHPRP